MNALSFPGTCRFKSTHNGRLTCLSRPLLDRVPPFARTDAPQVPRSSLPLDGLRSAVPEGGPVRLTGVLDMPRDHFYSTLGGLMRTTFWNRARRCPWQCHGGCVCFHFVCGVPFFVCCVCLLWFFAFAVNCKLRCAEQRCTLANIRNEQKHQTL